MWDTINYENIQVRGVSREMGEKEKEILNKYLKKYLKNFPNLMKNPFNLHIQIAQ